MMGIDLDVVSAAGCTLTARDGRKYTDLISGISVSSIGHCHPRVVAAVREQSARYMHLMVYGEYNQEPQARYAGALCRHLPASLDSVFFTTGGSEAVEGAMKLARRATGRTGIVSFTNAYHGSTQGALSLMGDETLKRPFRPLVPGTLQIGFNDAGDLGHITRDTAAVFAEPVQGEAGVRAADRDFLTKLQARCRETGALLVFDEIQTGFGRTGTLFAFEQYGVIPDVLLIAKAMGGGLPIGAFVAGRKLMSHLSRDPALGHINTFGGNAVCVEAARACLEVIAEGRLWERAAAIGRIILQELNHPAIREVRVSGALAAADFGDESLNMRVVKRCIESGVITDWFLFCPTAMRIAPPLVIGDDELMGALAEVRKAIDACAG